VLEKKIEGRGNIDAWEFGAVVETKGPQPYGNFRKKLVYRLFFTFLSLFHYRFKEGM
jgi:hypothetical protein